MAFIANVLMAGIGLGWIAIPKSPLGINLTWNEMPWEAFFPQPVSSRHSTIAKPPFDF
jgi:hypothetical protein